MLLKGGKCIVIGNLGYCACTTGWGGPSCSVSLQPATTPAATTLGATCMGITCLNGGVCIVLNYLGMCACRGAYDIFKL